MDSVLQPIEEIGRNLGLEPEDLESYGPYKAKIRLETLQRISSRPQGKYIQFDYGHSQTGCFLDQVAERCVHAYIIQPARRYVVSLHGVAFGVDAVPDVGRPTV